MAPNRPKRSSLWLVNIESEFAFSEEEKEILVQFFNEEAWRSKKSGLMILHDIFEGEKLCQFVVEAPKRAIHNLVDVFRNNLNLTISLAE